VVNASIVNVRALLVGQGIDLRSYNPQQVLARDPLTLGLADEGIAVLFRFGVLVMFGGSSAGETALLEELQPYIRTPFEQPQIEVLSLEVIEEVVAHIEKGTLIVPDLAMPRVQVIADILAKSVLLDNYERYVAGVFDRIEPLAERLRKRASLPRREHHLMRYLGDILQIQHRLVGRAEVGEKPEVLWEHGEHERLWRRLESEFEISERQAALDRKLEVIGNTAETLLGLLQDRHTLRVEWYIVILIVVEILLTLYELFFKHA
jgi:required for meiotic nuclear division protein 1